MSIGKFVHTKLGALDRPISELYRAVFLNLQDFIRKMAPWASSGGSLEILDVGCGEGVLTETIANLYPKARITGLDVMPTVGRMFGGDRSRVKFVNVSLEDFASTNANTFDLVIMSDVIHHIPVCRQKEILMGVKKILKSDGQFIIKEWQRTKTPICLLAYCADRYISSARPYFRSGAEIYQLLTDVFGVGSVRKEALIKPWRNNIMFLVKPADLI